MQYFSKIHKPYLWNNDHNCKQKIVFVQVMKVMTPTFIVSWW